MFWFNFLLFTFWFSNTFAQFANADILDVYDELAEFVSNHNDLPNRIRFNDDIVARPVSFTNYPLEETITFTCTIEADEFGSVPSWVSVSKENGMFGVFIIEKMQYSIRQRSDGSHFLHELRDKTGTKAEAPIPAPATDIAPNSVPVKISFEYTSKVWRGLLSKAEILAFARYQLDGVRYVFGPAGFDIQLADIILRPDVLRPDNVRAGESGRIQAIFRQEQNKPANSNIHVYMDRDLNGGVSHVGLAYYGLDAYFIVMAEGKWNHRNRYLFTHELGHLLGEGHTDCGSVMSGCAGVEPFYGIHPNQVERYRDNLRNPIIASGLAMVQDPTWKTVRIQNKKTCAEFAGRFRNCNKQADCMQKARETCTSGFWSMHITFNSYRCCASDEMVDNNGWTMLQTIELSTPYADFQAFNAFPELVTLDVDPSRVSWELLNDRAVCNGPGHGNPHQKLNAGAWYPDRMSQLECAQTIALNPDSCPSQVMDYIAGSDPRASRCRCCEVNYSVTPAFPRHSISRVSIIPNCGTWGEQRAGRDNLTHRKRFRGVTYAQCRVHCENFADCKAIRYDERRQFCDILNQHFPTEELRERPDHSVTDFTRSTSKCDDDTTVISRDCSLSTINPATQCTSECPLLTQTVLVPAAGNGQCNAQTHQCVSGEGECGAPVSSNEWATISSTKACEVNNEGITRTFGRRGFTLESCQQRCLDTEDCVAVDFYARSGWCNLFNQACTNPLREKGQSSSYRLVQQQSSKTQYHRGTPGGECNDGNFITSLEECRTAIASLGITFPREWIQSTTGFVSGCSIKHTRFNILHFNANLAGVPRPTETPICKGQASGRRRRLMDM